MDKVEKIQCEMQTFQKTPLLAFTSKSMFHAWNKYSLLQYIQEHLFEITYSMYYRFVTLTVLLKV